MEVQIIRSDRRTLALQVRPDGQIIVRAPRRLSQREIRRFVQEHWDWVEKQLRQRPARPAAEKLSEAELKQLKKAARADLTARAERLAPLVGVDYGRVSIRAQHSRWGSCSSQGNLNFNCLLMLVPEPVRDYVVAHELCHRLEMNHSPRFWAEVARVCPGYAAARKWLRDNGAALMARLG